MQDNKYTLIVNYPILAAGGIELSLASMMKWFLDEGHRVIWITTNKHIKNVAFPELVNDTRLEIIVSKWSRFIGTPRIDLQENERVIMFTCQASKYVVSEGIRRKAKTKSFIHYFVVAHFTGSIYYPEQFLKNKLLKKVVFRGWKKILQRIVEHNSIVGFSDKHLENYEAHYGVAIPDKEKQLMPYSAFPEFSDDLTQTRKKSAERTEKFIISTCSRLEFPHKAYVLGLVDAFATIKQQYPQAVLQIIGYGTGEQELQDKIDTQPEFVRKDIERIGMVSPVELQEYYRKAHLVVGLAGSVVTGVLCGTPSLVARHYCYECETYGFFADASEKVLSTDEGEAIVPYIASCITMEEKDFVAQVERAFEEISKTPLHRENYLFENFNKRSQLFVKYPWESFFGSVFHIIYSICRRLGERETI